jgi:hypothetical protein
MPEHAIGNARIVPRAGLMPVDPDLQRDDCALRSERDFRHVPPVDNAHREMKEEIDDSRLFFRGAEEQPAQHRSELWTDPLQARDGPEKRIEYVGPHKA